jgi:hypothetical protein
LKLPHVPRLSLQLLGGAMVDFVRQAEGDQAGYRHHRDRYRARATSLGFEGHMKWAETMP